MFEDIDIQKRIRDNHGSFCDFTSYFRASYVRTARIAVSVAAAHGDQRRPVLAHQLWALRPDRRNGHHPLLQKGARVEVVSVVRLFTFTPTVMTKYIVLSDRVYGTGWLGAPK